jgi:hypothetical protein
MYRPLPDFLEIKGSPIEGAGLFTTKDLDKGVNLGVTHMYTKLPFDDNFVRTPLGGFINHSDNPNCHLIAKKDFYTLNVKHKISAGEELTLKYGKIRDGF